MNDISFKEILYVYIALIVFCFVISQLLKSTYLLLRRSSKDRKIYFDHTVIYSRRVATLLPPRTLYNARGVERKPEVALRDGGVCGGRRLVTKYFN